MGKNSPLPGVSYHTLSTADINSLDYKTAELTAVRLIAERARVRSGGKILSWSEFNEDPDPLINRLLAKILVSQIDRTLIAKRHVNEIAVLSIENSAGYLASEITHEIERQCRLTRPPRIIRARKAPDGIAPSPAMGELQKLVTVYPITSAGKPRFLIASMPSREDLEPIRTVFLVDDFRATGDSLRGGIELIVELLGMAGVADSDLTLIPMAGLGKPDQEQEKSYSYRNANITGVYTAVNIRFWPDQKTGQAMIQTNGFDPIPMKLADARDFIDKSYG